MIYIAFGSNLPCDFGNPIQILDQAIDQIETRIARVLSCSSYYKSAPVPASDHPWYINGVLALREAPPPEKLLAELHNIEASFGRIRSVRNEPRALDLDILSYHDLCCGQDQIVPEKPPFPLTIPHPRAHERAFVLHPLIEIAPNWRHPLSRLKIQKLIQNLPKDQHIHPMGHAEISTARAASKDWVVQA